MTIYKHVAGVRADRRRIRLGVKSALALGGVDNGAVNVALVDDPTIHALNARHLRHNYPTDVLSFPIEQDRDRIEGDIVASVDTAAREAPKYGWSVEDELLLYVVHGALHLAGFDDLTPTKRKTMRIAERKVLAQFDLKPCYERRATNR